MATEMSARILIIDDEPHICRNCRKILSKNDYETDYTLEGHKALAMLAENSYDLVITDIRMGPVGGTEVLKWIRENTPETLVIIITGYASISSAVDIMKMGAFDYLPKPFTPDELRAVVAEALKEQKIHRQNKQLTHAQRSAPAPSHQLIGGSPQIKNVVKMVRKVADTDATVLLYGESGTGKELVARAIHANSSRQNKVFFGIDCGTLTGNLLESELFGYKKGAFTDASKDKEGIFQLADTGTVFLDEISNTTPDIQGKLLRFLDTREFMPLGGTSRHSVDVRLIFATNRDLKQMVAEGTFREDFYYRIYVYPIHLPPLRERKSDILPIAYHFLHQLNPERGKSICGFDDEAANRLIDYHWPGNIRQLRNTVERAVILCEGDRITAQDLPQLSDMGDIERLMGYVPETNAELVQVKKEIRQKAVARIEKNFLLHALAKNDWNITRAARETGLKRPNFQNMMKKYGIKTSGK
ncbi:MAG: sigma-54-dependent Fis family transcriptional regulator [Desulfobacterales bacterium]|nr:sigma-54-dependent Fis family transcriptional regulator [Desulfobacterales bacterium]